MNSTDWLSIAKRLQALSQTGLAFTESDYDRQRYQEIRDLSFQMMSGLSGAPFHQIIRLYPNEIGYQTPKVDVRGVVFRGTDEILMVQETVDENRWTLPGGWADVGYSPFEVTEKEVWEETGLTVKAVRLLAVFDKEKQAHPPQPWYVYKLFIRCEVTGGELLAETSETSGASWVKRSELAGLPLSTDRVTLEQLETMFSFLEQPEKPALCD